MRYALSENTEIVNKLLVESGDYNTFAQNDLGVSVTMNSHLALKAGWQARHNSDVAPVCWVGASCCWRCGASGIASIACRYRSMRAPRS